MTLPNGPRGWYRAGHRLLDSDYFRRPPSERAAIRDLEDLADAVGNALPRDAAVLARQVRLPVKAVSAVLDRYFPIDGATGLRYSPQLAVHAVRDAEIRAAKREAGRRSGEARRGGSAVRAGADRPRAAPVPVGNRPPREKLSGTADEQMFESGPGGTMSYADPSPVNRERMLSHRRDDTDNGESPPPWVDAVRAAFEESLGTHSADSIRDQVNEVVLRSGVEATCAAIRAYGRAVIERSDPRAERLSFAGPASFVRSSSYWLKVSKRPQPGAAAPEAPHEGEEPAGTPTAAWVAVKDSLRLRALA